MAAQRPSTFLKHASNLASQLALVERRGRQERLERDKSESRQSISGKESLVHSFSTSWTTSLDTSGHTSPNLPQNGEDIPEDPSSTIRTPSPGAGEAGSSTLPEASPSREGASAEVTARSFSVAQAVEAFEAKHASSKKGSSKLGACLQPFRRLINTQQILTKRPVVGDRQSADTSDSAQASAHHDGVTIKSRESVFTLGLVLLFVVLVFTAYVSGGSNFTKIKKFIQAQ